MKFATREHSLFILGGEGDKGQAFFMYRRQKVPNQVFLELLADRDTRRRLRMKKMMSGITY